MHGTKETPPPYPLSLERQCRHYHTLPEAGGMLAQDDYMIGAMATASNVYTLSQKRMKDYTGRDGKLKIWIEELRANYG